MEWAAAAAAAAPGRGQGRRRGGAGEDEAEGLQAILKYHEYRCFLELHSTPSFSACSFFERPSLRLELILASYS